MSSHKDHSHLEKIKEAVTNTELLSESEKSQTMQHIDEWQTASSRYWRNWGLLSNDDHSTYPSFRRSYCNTFRSLFSL
jgi:hypothetical protein